MLSQPAPNGWHRTVGIIGVGAASFGAAVRGDEVLRLAVVGPGIACGPDNPAGALGLAVALADDDVVEVVVNGPLSSEQPFLQPVATGPTNVGLSGPMVVPFAPAARTFEARALAAGAPPRTPTITTERDNSTTGLRTMLFRIRASLRAGPRNVFVRAGCSCWNRYVSSVTSFSCAQSITTAAISHPVALPSPCSRPDIRAAFYRAVKTLDALALTELPPAGAEGGPNSF